MKEWKRRYCKFCRLRDLMLDEVNWWWKVYYLVDYMFAYGCYKLGVEEYWNYRFDQLRRSGRKEFIVGGKRDRIYNICNQKEYRRLVFDKIEFNTLYDRFIKRRWINLSTCSFYEFNVFFDLLKEKQMIIKPTLGSEGSGVEIVKIAKEDDLFEWFTSLQTKLQKTKERWVGEELLVQSDEMRSFYPHAINTLRIYTLLGTDQVTRIMGAAVRWGNNGSHTDNIHNGGIAACVDVETGIVVSPGIDTNYKTYLCHPYSSKQIIGYKIEHWDKILAVVTEASRVLPQVRHVGWDVVIGKNREIIILEGNSRPDPILVQLTNRKGIWNDYKRNIGK